MNWDYPTWWGFALLSLAVYRSFRILCCDTVLDRLRLRLLRGRDKATEFILCVWCAGFWISLAWWLAWIIWPRWTLIVATPLAISAAVALLEINLGPDD